MRRFSKYLLLFASAPIILFGIVLAALYILLFLGNASFGMVLPLIGLFSGFVGASVIFSEFAKIFLFSLIMGAFSLGILYSAYKFTKAVWKDLPVKFYMLIFFLFAILVCMNGAIMSGQPVFDYFDQFEFGGSALVSETGSETMTFWSVLWLLLPYSLLALWYVRQRDKYVASMHSSQQEVPLIS